MFSKQDGALLTAQMLQGHSELYRLGQGVQTHAKGQRQGITNGMTGQQGIGGGVLNGSKQQAFALQGFGFGQHLPQHPCVGTHGTAGGVVAGVGEAARSAEPRPAPASGRCNGTRGGAPTQRLPVHRPFALHKYEIRWKKVQLLRRSQLHRYRAGCSPRASWH